MSASNSTPVDPVRSVPDLVPVTVPWKLQDTVYQVSKEVARLHQMAQSGILNQLSVAGVTSFREAVGNIKNWYKLRVVAVLHEESGRITLIPPNGEVVEWQYEVVERWIDVIRLPDGTIHEAAIYLESFKTKAKDIIRWE